MFWQGYTVSEEFKPIRITLSEEAFDRMGTIMKDAAFRSCSSTIEECIRAVFDIINEIHAVAGKRGDPPLTVNIKDLSDSWTRIIMRMYRFTGRRPELRSEE